jgi:alpha-1,2-mannosyltransferase
MRLPWWGANLMADPGVPRVLARVVQNCYSWWAILSLVALWLLVARRRPTVAEPQLPPSSDRVPA